jgi:hypothetical protein
MLKTLIALHLLHPVTRTAANHYRVGDIDVRTVNCTVTTTGLRARVETNPHGAWLVFVDAHGEVEADCQIAGLK